MSGISTNPVVGFPFTFAPFGFITGGTPNVPEFYWNVVSDEQRWKFLCVNLSALVDYANQLGVQIGVNADDIADLQAKYQELLDGGLLDYYEKQIYQWIQDNMEPIIKAAIRQVYFGLTDDTYRGGTGYFVAYIPESWNDIVFDTGMNPDLDTYGRLILRWDADSPYTVEQPPEYSYYGVPGLMDRLESIQNTADSALSLSTTNEQDIALNEADITELQNKLTNVSVINKGSTYNQIDSTGYLYSE